MVPSPTQMPSIVHSESRRISCRPRHGSIIPALSHRVGSRLGWSDSQQSRGLCVEERPLYLPCGQGEHLYIRIRNGDSPRPIYCLAYPRNFTSKAKSIGVAGLKDAQAVTTQMLSVQG